ncbi:MAG: hypothetical protein WC966_06455 [Bradymonadales bacterium]|jgi:TolB protein
MLKKYVFCFILFTLLIPSLTLAQEGSDVSPLLAQASNGAEAAKMVNDEAIERGVDPLSLITVVPGGPPTRIPIAVPDPIKIGDNIDPDNLGKLFADVVRNDLSMSGLFEIMPVETYALVNMQKEGMTTSTIQFDSWYNVGASVLVKTSYSYHQPNASFQFKLFNVDTASSLPFSYPDKDLMPAQVRAMAHDFVNALIEFYTGERGVFGTRLLYTVSESNNMRKIQSFETDGWGTHSYKLPDAINILPTWGPQNSIIYTQLASSGDNLFQYDGEELVQLTKFEGWASGADYCHSKKKLAFTAAAEDNANIYTMNLDGSELVQLTNLAGNIQTSPSWAPGCNRLAFVSDFSGKPQIYVIDADGSNMRRLTWLGNYNTTPDWSPKGDLIAFTARDERNVFDIFTVNVNTGEVTRLTQDQGHNKEPSWSPDGRYIVFESTRDGRAPRLYLMNADGRWQTRLSPRPGLRTPRWHR